MNSKHGIEQETADILSNVV